MPLCRECRQSYMYQGDPEKIDDSRRVKRDDEGRPMRDVDGNLLMVGTDSADLCSFCRDAKAPISRVSRVPVPELDRGVSEALSNL